MLSILKAFYLDTLLNNGPLINILKCVPLLLALKKEQNLFIFTRYQTHLGLAAVGLHIEIREEGEEDDRLPAQPTDEGGVHRHITVNEQQLAGTCTMRKDSGCGLY